MKFAARIDESRKRRKWLPVDLNDVYQDVENLRSDSGTRFNLVVTFHQGPQFGLPLVIRGAYRTSSVFDQSQHGSLLETVTDITEVYR